ncbi:MAG: type IV secretory system conjugative DNA transfer family protein [Pseudomonadota bacterium]
MDDPLETLSALLDGTPKPPLVPMPPLPVKKATLATATFESPNAIYVGKPKRNTFFIGCGEERGTVYGTNDDRHVLLCGGPRSGKAVSVAIPNLSLHKGSMVALDVKGELATTTARMRAGGSLYCYGMEQRTFVFDPMKVAGREDDRLDDLRACYNPLDFFDPGSPECIDDAMQIASSLCPEDTGGRTDPFFEETSRALIHLTILHVRTSEDVAEEDRNLNKVRELLAGGDHEKAEFWRELEAENAPSPYGLLFESMRRNKAFNGEIARVASRFEDVYDNAPKQFLGSLEIANRRLEFLQSPGMREMFSRSDLDLADLKRDPKGISIYLCLPPRLLETHYGFFRTMITMIIREMEKDTRPPASGAPVLMMLDEFAALKRMRVIENAVAQIAGYGVRMVFAVQSLSQLKDIYKDNWETFMGAVGLKLFMGNEDHFTRDYVTKLAGESQVSVHNSSTSRGSSESSTSGTTATRSEGQSLNRGESYGHGSGTGTSVGPGFLNLTSSRNRSTNKGTSFSETTTLSESLAHSSSTTTGTNESSGEQVNQQTRPLIRPDEVGRTGARIDNDADVRYPGALIAFVSGLNPIKLHRALYFRDEMFEGRFDPHPSHPYPQKLAGRLQARLMGQEYLLEEQKACAAQQLESQKREAIAAARKAYEDGAKATEDEYEEWLAREAASKDASFKKFLIGLVVIGPFLLAALIMLIAFAGYFGDRLLNADTFTFDAAWRAILDFPIAEPELWVRHLVNAFLAVISGIGAVIGAIFGWRLLRWGTPKVWRMVRDA